MISPQSSTHELGAFPFPTHADLAELCRAEGPCISIFFSPHRAGTGSQTPGTTLKKAIPEIRAALSDCGVHPQDVEDLTEPLEEMCDDSTLRTGHEHSLCIYRSPRELHFYSALVEMETAWNVDEHFLVSPLLAHLDYRKNFMMLCLAAKHLRLLRCEDGKFSPIPFPAGVPESQSEFTGTAGDAENISAPRTNSPHFLGDFMKAIDRGLQPLYRELGWPLVLVGVDEETAAYATVSEYPELVAETVKMSPDGGVSGHELAQAGAEIMKRWISPAEKQALAEFDKSGLARRSTDSAEILQAASKGQIKHLFLLRGAKLEGDARRLAGVAAAEGYVYRNDDLMNVAAVEVLLHKGNVWPLAPEQMPDTATMAAVMRYAGD